MCFIIHVHCIVNVPHVEYPPNATKMRSIKLFFSATEEGKDSWVIGQKITGQEVMGKK